MGVDLHLDNDQQIKPDQKGRPSLVGQTLPGNLHVLQRLGETSAGPLYRGEYAARYDEPSFEVSLVVLQWETYGRAAPRESGEPGFWRDRFYQSWIKHPNVLAIRGTGQVSGEDRFVATEPLAGDSLSKFLDGGVDLRFREAIDLFAQAAAGVEAVHDTGSFHGHLSPDCILVTRAEDGHHQLKLLPFELRAPSRPQSEARLPGTDVWLPYASPEGAAGLAMDERSDVYSLGVLLHYLLAGAPPYFAATRAGKVSEPVREVLLQALAPSPAKRFRTVGEFVSALAYAKPSLGRRLIASTWRRLAFAATQTLAVSRRALAFLARRTLAVSRRALAVSARAARGAFAATRRHARLTVVGLILALAIAGFWHFPSLLRHLIDTSRQQLVIAMRPRPAAESHPTPRAGARVLPAKTPEPGGRGLKARQPSDSSPQPVRRILPSRPTATGEAVVSPPPPLHLPAPSHLPAPPIESARVELGSSVLLSGDSVEDTPSVGRETATVQAVDGSDATRETSSDSPSESSRSTIASETFRDRAFQLALGDVQRLGIAIQVRAPRPGVLSLEVGPGLETVSSAPYTLGRLFSAFAAASLMNSDTVVELWRNGAKIGEVTSRGMQLTNSSTAPYER